MNEMMNEMMRYRAIINVENVGLVSTWGVFATIASVFATIMIFRRAGKEGWEALIPFYNDYTEYKLFWNAKMFWITMALKVLTVVGLATVFLAAEPVFVATTILGAACGITCMVLSVKRTQKTAHAFNRNGMFTVGLFFFTLIFRIILAFGEDEYAGANM